VRLGPLLDQDLYGLDLELLGSGDVPLFDLIDDGGHGLERVAAVLPLCFDVVFCFHAVPYSWLPLSQQALSKLPASLLSKTWRRLGERRVIWFDCQRGFAGFARLSQAGLKSQSTLILWGFLLGCVVDPDERVPAAFKSHGPPQAGAVVDRKRNLARVTNRKLGDLSRPYPFAGKRAPKPRLNPVPNSQIPSRLTEQRPVKPLGHPPPLCQEELCAVALETAATGYAVVTVFACAAAAVAIFGLKQCVHLLSFSLLPQWGGGLIHRRLAAFRPSGLVSVAAKIYALRGALAINQIDQFLPDFREGP
jgi:hypothetical protein